MIPYAIEIYGFISYIVPFFGTSGGGKIKKKFFWVTPPRSVRWPYIPRNPLRLNKLRTYFVHINLVTTWKSMSYVSKSGNFSISHFKAYFSAFLPWYDPHHHSRGDRVLEAKRKRLRKVMLFLSSCVCVCVQMCPKTFRSVLFVKNQS